MAIQEINVSTGPNTGNGDPIRAAFIKINQNFTTPANAASRMVGTQDGNVMGVGAFGVGGTTLYDLRTENLTHPNKVLGKGFRTGIIEGSKVGGVSAYCSAILLSSWHDETATGAQPFILFSDGGNLKARYSYGDLSGWSNVVSYRSTLNTTVDGNGFIKSASPIVQLFANKIVLNDEAKQQEIAFEKVDVGHYLIKGSSGFAQEGWYIETPKDANGNLLVAVVYEQLANGDISVKTYDYMLNKKGRIVADLETPLDIPEARWIDLRLQELPQPEIEGSESIAPPDFQPTNLAQAVAEALKDGAEQ